MKLKIWLISNRKTIQDFAEDLGVSRTHLGEVMNGKRKASLTLAKLIEALTKEEVSAKDVLNFYEERE